MQVIELRFHGDGEMEVKTSGFRGGKDCHTATQDIKDTLGVTIDHDTPTREATYQAVDATDKVQVRNS